MQQVSSHKRMESHDLPVRLREQFSLLKAKLWRVEISTCLVWMVLSLLRPFEELLDRWHDTPNAFVAPCC